MSTATLSILVIGSISLCAITVLLIVKLFFLNKKLNNSFAKLGYVVREDAKKYFDEAAGKLVDTNEEFRSAYVEIVEEGTKEALNKTAHVIEGSIVAAQKEANGIILRVRDDARRINVEARKMAVDEMARSLENAADTISWVMESFVKETFSIEEHKHIINRLVDEYLNEYKN